jgi:lipopolysaccharide assembly outer membrane protein LptD (OstA)|tara:strand:- start:559 stop:1140 length:582 start_codon:yes stop_codon:yes gene_type:complete
MTKNKKIQVILFFSGFILIFLTYFLYPKVDKKLSERVIIEDNQTETNEKTSNTFKNVEYQGIYNFNNNFTIEAEMAQILKDDPDVVLMNNMEANIIMNDGRTVVIFGDKGNYNKQNYDSFFEDNVKVTDGETVILADNLDLVASEDFMLIYNNVSVTNDSGNLIADKINYNFDTKFYKITMYGNKKVKGKLIK